MNRTLVKDARYVNEFKIGILFNDNDKEKRIVDFGKFLASHNHPHLINIRREKILKSFRLKMEIIESIYKRITSDEDVDDLYWKTGIKRICCFIG